MAADQLEAIEVAIVAVFEDDQSEGLSMLDLAQRAAAAVMPLVADAAMRGRAALREDIRNRCLSTRGFVSAERRVELVRELLDKEDQT